MKRGKREAKFASYAKTVVLQHNSKTWRGYFVEMLMVSIWNLKISIGGRRKKSEHVVFCGGVLNTLTDKFVQTFTL